MQVDVANQLFAMPVVLVAHVNIAVKMAEHAVCVVVNFQVVIHLQVILKKK